MGWKGGKGREMAQTMYAHMNKWILKKKQFKRGKIHLGLWFQKVWSLVAWPHVRGQNIMAARVWGGDLFTSWLTGSREVKGDYGPNTTFTRQAPLPKVSRTSQNITINWEPSVQNMSCGDILYSNCNSAFLHSLRSSCDFFTFALLFTTVNYYYIQPSLYGWTNLPNENILIS
jgi:hypothetical protein